MDFAQRCRYILSGDLVAVHYGKNSTATPAFAIDWRAEAAMWGEETRAWVSNLWAEDWDSPEDSVYDDE